MNRKILAGIVSMLILTGCYYDVEEELYGTCNTSNVNYSGTVNGILNSYGCLGCHTGATAGGNIRLSSYTEVKSRVDDGRLMGAIEHMNGFSPMPQGASKMSACDINKIKAWITAGSPNN